MGHCSMTVVLPVISACGQECCILPSAVLSTHTGGFGKPEVVHLTGAMDGIRNHWEEAGIIFDAIYVGYLGSLKAIRAVRDIMEKLLAPGGKIIVDPAMADHGKLYSGFDAEYTEAMKELCLQADVMMPNITEAAMMAGIPYEEVLTEAYVRELLERAAEVQTCYLTPELERRRLLLLAEVSPVELPADDRPLLCRAKAALAAGDAKRCTVLLEACEDRQSARWKYLRAEAAFALEDYEAAAEYYPEDCYARLEECYRNLGDYKKAYEYACKQR